MGNINWLFKGLAAFGLCVGLFVGLSVSPIVNSVVSLLFASIGGSIIFLIKDRNEQQLTIIGMSVFSMSVFMIIGAVMGAYAREGFVFGNKELKIELKPGTEFEYIENMAGKVDVNNLCLIAKNIRSKIIKDEVDAEKIKTMATKVQPIVLKAVLDGNIECTTGKVIAGDSGGLNLNRGWN